MIDYSVVSCCSVRPNKTGPNTDRRHAHFYSSLISDSEREREKKILFFPTSSYSAVTFTFSSTLISTSTSTWTQAMKRTERVGHSQRTKVENACALEFCCLCLCSVLLPGNAHHTPHTRVRRLLMTLTLSCRSLSLSLYLYPCLCLCLCLGLWLWLCHCHCLCLCFCCSRCLCRCRQPAACWPLYPSVCLADPSTCDHLGEAALHLFAFG